jgi:hypothetical protein
VNRLEALVPDFLTLSVEVQKEQLEFIRLDRRTSKQPVKAKKATTPKQKKTKVDAFEKAFAAMSEQEQAEFMAKLLKKKND